MKKRLLLLTLSLLSLDTFAAESAKALSAAGSRIVTPKQLPLLPYSEEIAIDRMVGTLFAAKYDFSHVPAVSAPKKTVARYLNMISHGVNLKTDTNLPFSCFLKSNNHILSIAGIDQTLEIIVHNGTVCPSCCEKINVQL